MEVVLTDMGKTAPACNCIQSEKQRHSDGLYCCRYNQHVYWWNWRSSLSHRLKLAAHEVMFCRVLCCFCGGTALHLVVFVRLSKYFQSRSKFYFQWCGLSAVMCFGTCAVWVHFHTYKLLNPVAIYNNAVFCLKFCVKDFVVFVNLTNVFNKHFKLTLYLWMFWEFPQTLK